jgi:hypothetical protein
MGLTSEVVLTVLKLRGRAADSLNEYYCEWIILWMFAHNETALASLSLTNSINLSRMSSSVFLDIGMLMVPANALVVVFLLLALASGIGFIEVGLSDLDDSV